MGHTTQKLKRTTGIDPLTESLPASLKMFFHKSGMAADGSSWADMVDDYILTPPTQFELVTTDHGTDMVQNGGSSACTLNKDMPIVGDGFPVLFWMGSISSIGDNSLSIGNPETDSGMQVTGRQNGQAYIAPTSGDYSTHPQNGNVIGSAYTSPIHGCMTMYADTAFPTKGETHRFVSGHESVITTNDVDWYDKASTVDMFGTGVLAPWGEFADSTNSTMVWIPSVGTMACEFWGFAVFDTKPNALELQAANEFMADNPGLLAPLFENLL